MIILMGALLLSCEKEENFVSFSLKLEGFSLEKAGDLSGPPDLDFHYKYSGGGFSFVGNDKRFTYNLLDLMVENYVITLPAGDYRLETEIPPASIYGQPSGSYTVDTDQIRVEEGSDTIQLKIRANCSLMLIADKSKKLEEGPYFIERHSYAAGYFTSYTMSYDSISDLYYAYFTPDPEIDDPSSFVWFFNDTPGPEKGGLPTAELQNKHQFYIEVLE